jgi:hypothetical protein
MNVVQSRREGFALAGAVLAMVLVGAIVTGGFYAAHQESRVTRSAELGDLAQYIAETGLDAVIGTMNGATMDAMAPLVNNTVANGVNVQYGSRTVGNYTVVVTRLTPNLYVVRSTGAVTIGQAGNSSNGVRTVSSVIRRRNVNFDNQTAMQVFGDLEVSGTSTIVGADTFDPSWAGCATTTTTTAVTAQPGADIDTQGAGIIAGSVDQSEPLDAGDFTVFGDLTWNDLVSMATNVYAAGATLSSINPSLTGTACNTSVLNNWGAPTSGTHACFNHFPIIYAPGDLHISSNSAGQGILLVAGDLSIQSQFDFYGPVVVMGIIDFQGGAEIKGSVFAYGGGSVGSTSSTAGNMGVQYSSCALRRATLGAVGLSRGVPIRNRSWMDLTTVQNSY